MRFTLIALPVKSAGIQLPNLGAISIAQTVREQGHQVNVIDANRYRHTIEDIVAEINKSRPDIIGISGIITSYYYFEPLTIKLKKRFPEIPLVVGGGITCVADAIEKYTPVDYLIKGEGEIVIVEFLRKLSEKKTLHNYDISGLFIRDDGRFKSPALEQVYPDISKVSFPAYDLYDMDYYIESSTKNAYRFLRLYPEIYKKISGSVKFFPVVITRGCPYSCSFCFRLIKKYRHPAIDNVIKHLRMIKENYGCSGINLLDELAIVDKNWFIEFCDALANELPGLSIFCGAGRANLLTSEIIWHARKAGFIRFGCGIESGSQAILNVLNKKTTVTQNYNAIKLVKEAGIMASCNFIFGCPGENKITLKETEDFIRNTLDPRDCTVNLAVAYPGASLFTHAVNSGILKKEQIRDYILNVSFGDYPLNFSGFDSGDKLCREVNLMFLRLKLHFMRKNSEYRIFLSIIKHLIKDFFYFLQRLNPGLAKMIRGAYNEIKLRNFNKKRRKERLLKQMQS